MKIAVTVCYCGDVVNAGGDPHRVTSIIDIPDENVPTILRKHFETVREAKEHKEKYGTSGYVYETVSFSLVEEAEAFP